MLERQPLRVVSEAAIKGIVLNLLGSAHTVAVDQPLESQGFDSLRMFEFHITLEELLSVPLPELLLADRELTIQNLTQRINDFLWSGVHIDFGPKRPLSGRMAELAPVVDNDWNALYQLLLADDALVSWRLEGHLPSGEELAMVIRSDTHLDAAFRIRRDPSGRFGGYISVFRANLYDKIAQLSIVLHPRLRGSGIAGEAALLFIDHAFAIFPWRKLCFEATDDTLALYSSVQDVAEIEATLKSHRYVRGRYVDVHLGAIHREHWLASERVRNLLARCR